MIAFRRVRQVIAGTALVATCILFVACLYVPAVRTEGLYLLTEHSQEFIYENITENTLTCDINTLSNIVLAMQRDSYVISTEDYSTERIDLVLSSSEYKHRLVYDIDSAAPNFGKLTIITNPYEKSYIPVTYISEGK